MKKKDDIFESSDSEEEEEEEEEEEDEQEQKLEINCGGITNKQNINGIILEETFREIEQLCNIRKNPFLTNKNDTKSEKICVNIKQKKKIFDSNILKYIALLI